MSTAPAPACSTMSAIVAHTACASHMLKIDGYSRTKSLATGVHLTSCSLFVGGHSWHIAYFPNGDGPEMAEFISLFLVLDNAPAGGPVLSQFTISLLNRAGKPVPSHDKTIAVTTFAGPGASSGFSDFIKRETLENKSRNLLKDDCFSVKCDVTVVTEFRAEGAASAGGTPALIAVPPSDLPRHFGDILASGQGTDVGSRVDGEDFAAHRCVLAVRSPVFKAELYGAMNEGREAHCLVIEDMRADVFRNLLHFVYTDTLPEQTAEEEALMAQHLLVAADRYGMERLKIICEDKLCRHIDVSTLVTTLALAEQHRCQGLKDACIEFLKTPGALNTVMATDGFHHLAISCPCLIKDLMRKLAVR